MDIKLQEYYKEVKPLINKINIVMTRKEVFKFYEELVESGKISDFYEKMPENMTPKELDLLGYDDGHVMYNPCCGSLTTYDDPYYKGPKLNLSLLKSLGHLGSIKTRAFSDLTEEELKLFNDCGDDKV